MNSKNYGAYAKNINNYDDKLFNIEDLVVGNILKVEKHDDRLFLVDSQVKYIFEVSKVGEDEIFREALSNKEFRLLSNRYDGPYVNTIEDLSVYIDIADYISDRDDKLLNYDDIFDLQELVNVINKDEEKKNKKSL